MVAGADVVAAAPGAADVEGLGANNPVVGAAAGVDDGAAEDVVPPRVGKSDFWGAAAEAAGAPSDGVDAPVLAVVLPPRENAGFAAESPPAEGILKSEDPCVLGAAPAAGVVVPNRLGFGVLSAAVVGVEVPAGFGAKRPLPPAAPAAGVDPNAGLGVVDVEAAVPKRPPDVCGWVAAGVVEKGVVEVGVVDELAFNPPPNIGVLVAGGGPAGVVELLPNKDPPEGPGVVEAPNALPPAPPPKRFPPAVALGVAASVFAGVELPPNDKVDG